MWGANSTLTFLFSSFSFFSPTPEPPKIIAQTPLGKFEGSEGVSRDGRSYNNFVGIPFAQPPTGDLRFKPPVPLKEPWEDVRDASQYGAKCLQYHLIAKFLTGEENCLFLNVYTHKFQRDQEVIQDSELKPVMAYFHGGLWMQGSSQFYQPKYWMDEDVVFVTLQYRLGSFGFLSLDNDDMSGNMALKDQVLGLQWIKDNIRSFGGDPNLVTIMGESAGSVAVHYHLLSPMSRGLFHRAISQSGTALVSWGSEEHPFEQAIYFAEKLNCTRDNKEEMAKCLRSLDAEEIARAQRAASNVLHEKWALFGPTLERNRSIGTQVFLPDKPENLMKDGNIAKVPWICGCNSEEGLLTAAFMVRNDTIREELTKNWTFWAPIVFKFDEEPNKKEIAEKLWEFYFGTNSSTEINMDTYANLTLFLTDRTFFEGMHNTLKLHRGQHPIYPYVYSYQGIFSFAKFVLGMSFNLPIMADVLISSSWSWISRNVWRSRDIHYGTAHGDELPLMFNLPFQKIHSEGTQDYEMSKTLIQLWTSFARDGVPMKLQDVQWPELSAPGENETDLPIKLLRLGKKLEVVDEPFHSRANFWDGLNLFPYKRSGTNNLSSLYKSEMKGHDENGDNTSSENEL